jgi:hypothetical protein
MGLFQSPAFGSITGRVLFLDLDVVITGSLDELVQYPTEFAMHRDFMNPGRTNASAVMLVDVGAVTSIWESFSAHAEKFMQRHKAGGDQEFLTRIHPQADLFPKRWIVSYRLAAKSVPPPDARVVCFHGTPKPHECPQGWVTDLWI